jgi:hypothetical protein
LKRPNFTKIRGIATWCWDLIRLWFGGILYQILSYDSHIRHYAMTYCYSVVQPLVPFAGGNIH